jgi:phosphoglycolate phosphatase-like HAD superfamily hydrolase
LKIDIKTVDIKQYKTIVFDCDGVVLNSNIVKTEAYFRTAKKFGATDAQAQVLVDYHVKLGGISRYHKFDWFVRHVLQQAILQTKEMQNDALQKSATDAAIQALLAVFSDELADGLMQCDLAKGLFDLRDKNTANWLILSGGDQLEIRELFAKRKIAHLFNGGLFGSPDNKDEVLAREIANENIQLPALFIGDAKYDFEAASRAGLDFVFMSDWTEVPNWQAYCADNYIESLPNIASLLAKI